MRLEASSFKVILGDAIRETRVVEDRKASERWAPEETDLTGRIQPPLLSSFGIITLFITVMSWGPLLLVVCGGVNVMSLWPASGTNSRLL